MGPVTISATATSSTGGVVASNKTLEMALALDNTGSMTSDMQNLQNAATSLVNTVMGAGNGSNVKVSVVPYVAVVNPGIMSTITTATSTDMTMVDTTATTYFNASWFRNSWIAYNTGCVQSWSGSNPNSGTSNSGDAGDASDFMELISPFRRVAQELFGVSSAHAQVATPAVVTPASGPTLSGFTTYSWSNSGKYLQNTDLVPGHRPQRDQHGMVHLAVESEDGQ